MVSVGIVVAVVEKNNGIGRNNKLPWNSNIKEDMDFFKRLTTGATVVMGKNTWLSIPEKFRPLPKRTNVVISKTITDLPEGVLRFNTYDDFINYAELNSNPHTKIFVIGGAKLYEEALNHASITMLYISYIKDLTAEEEECDTFFPQVDFSKYSDMPCDKINTKKVTFKCFMRNCENYKGLEVYSQSSNEQIEQII